VTLQNAIGANASLNNSHNVQISLQSVLT